MRCGNERYRNESNQYDIIYKIILDDDYRALLLKSGFKNIQIYGDYDTSDYNEKRRWLNLKLKIIGSGGMSITPSSFCKCKICEEAREKGGRYERLGPSLYIDDIKMLIDTPEDIAVACNRQKNIRSKTPFNFSP